MLLLRKYFNVDCFVGCMVDSIRRHYFARIPLHQKHLRMAQQLKLLSHYHVRLPSASTLNNLHQAGMHRRGGFLDMENQILPEYTRFITQTSPDLRSNSDSLPGSLYHLFYSLSSSISLSNTYQVHLRLAFR